MVTALQSFVRSLLDCTYPVMLTDMSDDADSAIDAGCDWLKARVNQ